MTFLRRVKRWIDNLAVGETILLPLLVEGEEILLVVNRKTAQSYKFVVVNTNPLAGLGYHPVSAAISTKKIKYKTCLVFDDIPKQQAMCEVFLSSLYNLTIHKHESDTDKFYDILIPFLTGKPFESSLVEIEENDKNDDEDLGWRTPQRSSTAYVRTILHAIRYMLMDMKVPKNQCKRLSLALRSEFLTFLQNDLNYMHPDSNGQRIARLACQQISYAAVKFGKISIEKHQAKMHLFVTDNESKTREREKNNRQERYSSDGGRCRIYVKLCLIRSAVM